MTPIRDVEARSATRPAARPPARLVVRRGDDLVDVVADATFGRSADIVVGAHDPLLHREVGALGHRDGRWVLTNRARRLSLVLTDATSPSYAILAPGRRMALPYAANLVSFSTLNADYRLGMDQSSVPAADDPAAFVPDSDATATSRRPLALLHFNDEQLQLLRALAAPRLAGPVTAADLPGNARLAEALGWSRSKLNRKLDHLCLKFHRAGLPGMVSGDTGAAVDRRLILANHAVENGMLATPGRGDA